MSASSERDDRAARRAAVMQIQKGKVGTPSVDLSPTRGIQAIALASQLSFEAFSLAGQIPPEYTRAEIPIRFVPRGRTGS